MKVFTSKTQQLGQKGEEIAALFLMKQGYTIVERNVANKYGEIDIVAKKAGIWHFFEVKSGRSGSWFNAAENLTEKKLRKFKVSAEYYALSHRIKDFRMQGIVVKISPNMEGETEIMDIV